MSEMLYDQLARIGCRTDPEAWARMYSRSVVYDLSSIWPLFRDWDRMKESNVPKSPPHDRIWCEWTDDKWTQDDGAKWRCAIHMARADERASSYFRKTHGWGEDIRDIWSAMMFGKVIASRTRDVVLKANNGALFEIAGTYTIGTSEDQSSLLYEYTPLDGSDWTYFNIGIMKLTHNPPTPSQPFHPWAAFAAFSLLHCKNVKTETILPPKQPKKFKERGYPPFCSYKVLKIQVPVKANASQSEDDLESEPSDRHVRFHLCRGHFKQMKHPKFKRQGEWYWVPAHWKGQKELGVVVKDYKMVPAK